MKPGDAVVIYGCGPVGLMAASIGDDQGACSVMVVDCHPDRLKLAAPQRHEHPDLTLSKLINSVKFTGGIGVVGVFVPTDPGGPDQLEKQGKLALDWGMLWFKGHRVATGQCPVKACNRQTGPGARRLSALRRA